MKKILRARIDQCGVWYVMCRVLAVSGEKCRWFKYLSTHCGESPTEKVERFIHQGSNFQPNYNSKPLELDGVEIQRIQWHLYDSITHSISDICGS